MEPTVTLVDYDAAMRAVLAKRQAQARLDEAVKAARAAWEAEHADLLASAKAAVAETLAAEETARQAALLEADLTGQRTLRLGAVVRESDRLVYESPRALAWAMAKGICLSLDVRAFEKVAKTMAVPLDFVTVETVRTVALPNVDRLAEAIAEADT